MNIPALIVVISVFLFGASWAAPAHGFAQAKAKQKVQSGTKQTGKKAGSTAAARRTAAKHRAFVASSELKPMARQLLAARSKAAYQAVEAYARRHADEAGSLAYFVLGYAHFLDRDYALAITALKKAQLHQGDDLGDYIAYFLASSYSAAGNATAALDSLQEFSTKYPNSIFLRDAALVYGNALLVNSQPAEAALVLEKHREPLRADGELVLGRAYLQSGERKKAIDALKRVYVSMPASNEASIALAELTQAGYVPTLDDRRLRASALGAVRRWSEAASEYRIVVSGVEDSGRRYADQVALGVALHRSGASREARQILESLPDNSTEANGQRLLILFEIARRDADLDRCNQILARMRQTVANSPYFENALLQGGNVYLLRREYDRASDYYRELQQRFPSGDSAAYAHWKSAWLSLRQGRIEEAKRGFEQQIRLYPASQETPGALYWRARLAEEDDDLAKARAYYVTLDARFRHYYYGELARERLKKLGSASLQPASSATIAVDPLLQSVPTPPITTQFDTAVPAGNPRAQKALLLANGGLLEFADRELRAAGGETSWVAFELARLYQDNEQHHRTIRTMKGAIQGYFSMDIGSMPKSAWHMLFPRPYWSDLQRYSASNRLDPLLVASLIRQESEFNPGAVSRSNALGLMQILPSTGKRVARSMKIRSFSSRQLLLPKTNMQLGTRYLRGLIDRFGEVEYALAAYNAGPERVQEWLTETYRDTPEFVESIPLSETRQYVKAILSNADIYRSLYAAQ